jgi:hypothetical protein
MDSLKPLHHEKTLSAGQTDIKHKEIRFFARAALIAEIASPATASSFRIASHLCPPLVEKCPKSIGHDEIIAPKPRTR